MPERINPTRWSKEDSQFLFNLFKEGEADPKIKTATKIKEIYKEHPRFEKYKRQNFYNNYRKTAANYITEQSKRGIRGGEIIDTYIFFINVPN